MTWKSLDSDIVVNTIGVKIFKPITVHKLTISLKMSYSVSAGNRGHYDLSINRCGKHRLYTFCISLSDRKGYVSAYCLRHGTSDNRTYPDNASSYIVYSVIINTQCMRNHSLYIKSHNHGYECVEIQDQCILRNLFIVLRDVLRHVFHLSYCS